MSSRTGCRPSPIRSGANAPPRRYTAGPPGSSQPPLLPCPRAARRSRVAGLAACAQLPVFDLGTLMVVMHGVGQVLETGIPIERGGGLICGERRRVGDFVTELRLALLDRDFAQAGKAGGAKFDGAADVFVIHPVGKDPEAIGALRHLDEVCALIRTGRRQYNLSHSYAGNASRRQRNA